MTKEELLQELNECAEEIEEYEGSYGYMFDAIADMVKDSDLVEVVRCKDCKFNYANQIPSDDVCQLCVELPISKDFYCAYGEKTDEVEDENN